MPVNEKSSPKKKVEPTPTKGLNNENTSPKKKVESTPTKSVNNEKSSTKKKVDSTPTKDSKNEKSPTKKSPETAQSPPPKKNTSETTPSPKKSPDSVKTSPDKSPINITKKNKVDIEQNGKFVTTAEEEQSPKSSGCEKCNCLEVASDWLISSMEGVFYKTGCLIGKRPWIFLIFTFVFLVACGVGTIFNSKAEGDSQWYPKDSQFLTDKAIVDKYFPAQVSVAQIIIEADANVLTANIIQKAFVFDAQVRQLGNGSSSFQTVCIKVFGNECLTTTILELWNNSESTINALDDATALSDINSVTVSPITGAPLVVGQLLGGTTYSGSDIASAKVMSLTYYVSASASGNLDFQTEFLSLASKGLQNAPGTKVYYFAVKSFFDVVSADFANDQIFLGLGNFLVVAYLLVILGRFNCKDFKLYMAIAGLILIGFSVLVAYGLAGYLRFESTDLHSILPFLLLGIGVDDIFIITVEWENVVHFKRPLHERVGLMVKNAGVSIVVTSMTDIVAFAAGATTILPALQSFCIYCSLGILGIYTLTFTFFVPLFVYDQRRAARDLNAFICCYKHEDYEECECSKTSKLVQFLEKIYCPVMFSLPMRIISLILIFLLFGFGVYFLTQLEQNFDFRWFIPDGTYLSEYFSINDKYYPSDGLAANVYFVDVDYYTEKDKILSLYETINNLTTTKAETISFWYKDLVDWFDSSQAASLSVTVDPNQWPTVESELYSIVIPAFLQDQQRYRSDVKMNMTSFEIFASRLYFSHVGFSSSSEEINGMDATREAVLKVGYLENQAFAFSDQYGGYETNKVIKVELFRNLLVAFACVFVICLILLANIQVCLILSLGIGMVLVDLGGYMHAIGLTIDTITTIFVIIAIGLSVDYSAHIAHSFMTEVGTRRERAAKAIVHIGPAVLSGAFSTFLAFALLAFAKTYVFEVFFKIFFMVILFGLIHGFIFLPTVLSFIGPKPYLSAIKAHEENEMIERRAYETEKEKIARL